MSLLDNLPHTINIFRIINTQDPEYGGDAPSEGPTPYAADVACWIQVANSSDVREFASKDAVVTHAIYLTSDPGIRYNDTIVVTGDSYYAGKTFIFKGFAEDSVGADILFKAMTEIYRQLG